MASAKAGWAAIAMPNAAAIARVVRFIVLFLRSSRAAGLRPGSASDGVDRPVPAAAQFRFDLGASPFDEGIGYGRMARNAGRKAFGNRRNWFQNARRMAILLTFLLGIGNFALHRAVLEQYRPLIAHTRGGAFALGGGVSRAAEFAVLRAAMLLAATGHTAWGWAYLGYSLFNGITAGLILRHRV